MGSFNQQDAAWGTRFMQIVKASARSQFAHYGRCFSFFQIDGTDDAVFIQADAIPRLRDEHPGMADVFDQLEKVLQEYDPEREIVLLRTTDDEERFWISRLDINDSANILTFATVFRSLTTP